MNTTQLYKNLQKIVSPVSKNDFVYDLLEAYGEPKSNITKLKNGTMNKSNVNGQIIRANKILFQPAKSDSLFTTMEALRNDQRCMRHKPRFFVVTDYKSLLAYDTKVDDTLDIRLEELPKNLEFFMPWAGRERYAEAQENPADVKAAERMARLYDEILRNNPDAERDPKERHKLNVFLSRLLFCFFAEDTDIFPNNIFSKAIHELTEEDGSDLDAFLNQLFEVLNTKNRKGCIDQLCKFPYVNGGLFGDSYDAPKMTRRARRMIIDCGALDWSEINPDIFGSMIQAVVDPEQRGGLGMHYTSVPNIMKVIEPLFLNDLWEEFEKGKSDVKKLAKLLNRISRIRFFDPACGSGNFLIITYKEIRKLEMAILEQRKKLDGYIPLHSLITLDHFYGIEIDDFAHEVAILSLWLAEHQMNVQFKEKFGNSNPALPLKESGNIVASNAIRIDWKTIFPRDNSLEGYIIGNPPYLGYKDQTKEQKKDIASVQERFGKDKKIDLISCWILKAAEFIQGLPNYAYAFVSTNSICQGVAIKSIWPHIFDLGLELGFAHTSFKWTNSAKSKAAIICIVVGIRNRNPKKKYLFENGVRKAVSNISPYLIEGSNSYVSRQAKPLNDFPRMGYGNLPNDGGHLLMSSAEREDILDEYPEGEALIRRAYGSKEYINGLERYCLWIPDNKIELAMSIPPIAKRINKVREVRLASRDKGARDSADTPHKFWFIWHKDSKSIIIPRTSSERREYIPIGFLDKDSIVTDSAFAIYDHSIDLFAFLSSRMHMTWVRAVAGRLKTDYRYSTVLCYNTFPVPSLTSVQFSTLERQSQKVLDLRDEQLGKTLAQLYDPDKMPDDLREAHRQLDLAVDGCYREKPFENDSERLEHLFKMYEKMTA